MKTAILDTTKIKFLLTDDTESIANAVEEIEMELKVENYLMSQANFGLDFDDWEE